MPNPQVEAFQLPEPRVEPTPRWLRVGPGMLPTYCFPADDVRADLLAPSPVGSGGFVIDHDVRAGDHVLGLANDEAAAVGSLTGLRGPRG